MKKEYTPYLLFSFLILLVAALLSWRSPNPWFGFISVSVSFIIFFAPLAFFKKEKKLFSFKESVLIFSSGLGLLLLLSFFSLLIWKETYQSGFLFFLLALFGLWKHGKNIFSSIGKAHEARKWDLFSLGVFVFLLSYIVNGQNYIWSGDNFVVTWCCDWFAHIDYARRLLQDGLPAPKIAHRGLQILMLALSQLTGVELREAPKILGIHTWFVISFSMWLLLKEFKVGRKVRIFLSLVPFFWGSFSLLFDVFMPEFEGLKNPYMFGYIPRAHSSGLFFFNLTQVVSLLFATSFMLSFESFLKEKKDSYFVLGVCFLCLSMLVKPAAFIVLFPALCICLALTRMSLKYWLYMFSIFSLFFLIYIHAVVFGGSQRNSSSSFSTTLVALRNPERFITILVAFGVLLLPYVDNFLRSPFDLIFKRKITLLHLLSVALFGGVLFALFFYEPRKFSHGNHNWPYKALLLLSSPLFLAYFLAKIRKKFWKNIFMALACVNILSGALFFYIYFKEDRFTKQINPPFPGISLFKYIADPRSRVAYHEELERKSEQIRKAREYKRVLKKKKKERRAEIKEKIKRRRKLKERKERRARLKVRKKKKKNNLEES